MWWCRPGIPALGRLRQEDCDFRDNLGHIVKPYFKTKQKQLTTTIKKKKKHKVILLVTYVWM